VKWLKESQFWKWLSLHVEDFGENIIPIAEFSLTQHIMRLLQTYLTLEFFLGYFWLKLDKLDNYRTFCSAYCYKIVYTVGCCNFAGKMVYTVGRCNFTVKSVAKWYTQSYTETSL
jgi:hypothetical protein